MPEISHDTIALVIGLLINFAGMTIYLGRYIGQTTSHLHSHDEKHTRHTARLDEHQKIIGSHGQSIAVLKIKELERNV